MAWRESWRPPSFRGVPFAILQGEEPEEEGGRAVAVHRYAGGRPADPEDVGRAPDRLTVQGFVDLRGGEEPAARLEEALRQSGPGELVHPRRGAMQVQPAGFTRRSQGPGASFRMSFVLAPGGAPGPVARADSAALSAAAADDLAAVAATDFAAVETAGLPDWAVEVGAAPLAEGVDALLDAYGAYSAGGWWAAAEALAPLAGDALAAAREAGLGAALLDGIGDIPFAPEIAGAVESVFAGVTDIAAAASDALSIATPIRRAAADNAAAGAALIRRAGLVARAKASAARAFRSYDEAAALRALLVGDLRAEAERAADAGADPAYRALAGLAGAVTRDLTARAADKARLVALQAPPGPALAMAHRLYGEAGRVEEVLDFAPTWHPLFHPGEGRVLSAGPAGSAGSETIGKTLPWRP